MHLYRDCLVALCRVKKLSGRDLGSQSIDAWLKSIGLEQYTEAFRVNDIDMEVVETLGNDDLKELGLSLGHRKKFEKALVAL